jgi:rod shape-determining protein MreC
VDERRTAWLLIVVLVGQLILVAIEGARSSSSVTYAESLGLYLLGPVARAVAATSGSLEGLRGGIRLQRSLLAENRALRRQVEDLRLRLLRLADVEEELARLGEAIRYAAPLAGQIRAVDVVFADRTSWLRTLILYTGSQSASIDQPVLSPAGVVGRVVMVAGPYAKVQLVTDRAASVGGMLLRTRRQGLVRGSGQASGGLNLEYMLLQADVRPGDRVVTAGIDGIYPRGIPVGTVVSVEPGGELFHKIRLAPAVDFAKLDQVYLLDHVSVPREIEKAVPGARP